MPNLNIFKKKNRKETPNVTELESELSRVNYRARLRRVLKNTIYALVVASAAAVLVAVLFMPILRIYGNSMTPTLTEGEIVISLKGPEVKQGDVIGLYYGSKLLIKRCIAQEHQWVNIDSEGNVYVDGEYLDEPYISEKAFGECNLTLPYQVPDGCVFVMGDHRETSIDSRNSSVGCIAEDKIVGKIVFRIWPFDVFGKLNK